MKIGILTFHCAYNFGAMLQAYALQETLKSLGHSVEIINYRPDYLETKKPDITWRSFVSRNPFAIKAKIQSTLNAKAYYKAYNDFENQYFNLSDISVPTHYDRVILGSDQIWNRIYNGNDSIWYGGLPTGITCDKIITYAASAGDATESELDRDAIVKNSKRFSSILVREEALCQQLASLNIPSMKVVDPTLIANDSVWNEWQHKIFGEKYIIVYQGRSDDKIISIAKRLAYQKKCQVITVDQYPNSFDSGLLHVNISPREFVEAVRHAECVVTSSFHGTAISIITSTPFYTIRMNDGADNRSIDLLNSLGLQSRMIDKNSSPIYSKVDFTSAKSVLSTLREESLDLLINSLK